MSKQLSLKRAPVRIEISSSTENIQLLDKDPHEILIDASNCCGFSNYVNKDGETCVNIECIVDEDSFGIDSAPYSTEYPFDKYELDISYNGK